MDNFYYKHLQGHSSGLKKEYLDIKELERNLFGLETLLKIQKEELTSSDEEKKERLLYIKDIEDNLKQVKYAIDEFPSTPELPPTRPLEKISGTIEHFTVKKVIGYFDFSEYVLQKEQVKNKQSRDNIGAVLVMITQLFSGSIIHARIKNGEKRKYKCIYIEGVISGKKFSGWLGKTNIQVGDNIEMVVLPDGEDNRLYALANPQQRTVSMIPGCIIGLGELSLFKLGRVVFLSFAFIFLFIALFSQDVLFGVFVAYVIASCIVTAVIHRGVIKDKTPQCLLFEQICNVLNIPNGHNLDLMSFTDKKIEKLKISGEWIPPEKQTIAMPQDTAKNSDEYFYYY